MDDLEQAEILERRDTLDRNEKLSGQLHWLHDCGFSDVEVVYRNRIFMSLWHEKDKRIHLAQMC